MTVRIIEGDCRAVLRDLPDQSVHCIVTSPPYFSLRSYLPVGHPAKAAEMGSEPSPAEFVGALVELFREIRRVLRDDGMVWLNLGDSYGRGDRPKSGGDAARGTGAHDPIPCTVLDPFGGAGTTGLVADRLGRDAILIELNESYAAMARKRIAGDAGLFASVE
jgi:DNA modification methylase